MPRFDVVAFDGDDTLWHNEPMFRDTEDKLRALLVQYNCAPVTDEELCAREERNLQHFGYGTKGFALSMIETAIELTDGQIGGRDIQTLIEMAKAMLSRPLQLLDGVEETLAAVGASHRLMLVTKGDLLEQEAKIARSGIADHFAAVEIVSAKTTDSYRRVFAKHGFDPRKALMVGNSLRSDVVPVVELGGYAVHIPYPTTWIHETVDPSESGRWKYTELEDIRLLPGLLDRLDGNGAETPDGLGRLATRERTAGPWRR